MNNVIFVDRVGKHPRPRLFNKNQNIRLKTTGVTIHQTGCIMPGGSTGWDTLNAHIGISRDGVVYIVNSLDDFIWHAQGLSASTIGVEIEGNLEGVVGESWTHWKQGGRATLSHR